MRRPPPHLLSALLLSVANVLPTPPLYGVDAASLSSTPSFNQLARGASLALTWDDGVSSSEADEYPIYLTAQLIDRGENGHSANGFTANLTTAVSKPAYTWQNVPYPLQWVPSGLYAVEVRARSGRLVAKSPFFGVPAEVAGPSQSLTTASVSPTSAPPESPVVPGNRGAEIVSRADMGLQSENEPTQTPTSESPGGSATFPDEHRQLAVGLGSAIGASSAVALVVLGCCYRRRRSGPARAAKARLAEEKRRRMRREFIIH